jgi:hypothetical protein
LCGCMVRCTTAYHTATQQANILPAVWYAVVKGTPFTTEYHTATQQANILPAHWLNYTRREYVTTAVVLAKHKLAPWGWFWYEPQHVGADDRLLTVLIFCDFNCVRHCWIISSPFYVFNSIYNFLHVSSTQCSSSGEVSSSNLHTSRPPT